MRVLGVHGTSQELYLAVADGGLIVAGMPERFTIPDGLALSPDLVSLRDEVRRRLREMSVDYVVVLAAESQRQAAHTSWAPRIAAETIVRMATAPSDIASEMISRQKVRSLLQLPAKGKLDDHASTIVPDAVGAYWAAGRSVAALITIAIKTTGLIGMPLRGEHPTKPTYSIGTAIPAAHSLGVVDSYPTACSAVRVCKRRFGSTDSQTVCIAMSRS